MYDEIQVHYVSATVIVVKDGKYLISQRSHEEKAFPGWWTVPGGKLKTNEYMNRPKDTNEHWYNVLEGVARREVAEEVGLEIKKVEYLTSLVYIRPDNIPSLIVSFYGEHALGEVELCKDLIDYKWVTLEEAKNYELIEGIYEEIEILDNKLKGVEVGEWAKK